MDERARINREFRHLDLVPVGACLLRRNMTVLYWSSFLESWTGITRGEILGTRLDEQFEHFREPMYAGRIETVFDGGPPAVFSSQLHPYIVPARLKDGRFRRQQGILVSVEAPEGSGQRCGLLLVEDVTDLIGRVDDYRRMRDEAQLQVEQRRKAEVELRRAHDLLEEKVRQRTAALVASNKAICEEISVRHCAENELRAWQRRTDRMLTSLASLLIGVDREGNVIRWNVAAEETLGQSAEKVLQQPMRQCGARWDWDEVLAGIDRAVTDETTVRLEDVDYTRPDGTRGILELIVSQVQGEANQPDGYTVLGMDVSRQRLVESQLAQAQKLEAMGELAAGIAHEINTPTQYVGDNTRFLQEAFGDLREFLLSVHEAVGTAGATIGPLASLAERWKQMDLDYLLAEVPQAISQSLEGIDRVKTIVMAMKEFSHPQDETMSPVDLNHAIRSTVTVCRNEWKYVAEMELDLDPKLPPVPCHAGEINQVVLNLTVNAAHGIQEQLGNSSDTKGRITISTEQVGDAVEIRIADTGCGIPPEIQAKVFDLFFTTKPAGRGTGQGLAIARAAVVEKHGGSIDMVSEPGEGTTFIIQLPLRPAKQNSDADTSETISSQ